MALKTILIDDATREKYALCVNTRSAFATAFAEPDGIAELTKLSELDPIILGVSAEANVIEDDAVASARPMILPV